MRSNAPISADTPNAALPDAASTPALGPARRRDDRVCVRLHRLRVRLRVRRLRVRLRLRVRRRRVRVRVRVILTFPNKMFVTYIKWFDDDDTRDDDRLLEQRERPPVVAAAARVFLRGAPRARGSARCPDTQT